MSKRRRKKSSREADITRAYQSGNMDEDEIVQQQKYSQRSRQAQGEKMARTALLRAQLEVASGDIESLPLGEVIQVYSLYCEVEHDGRVWLCVLRKTLNKLSESCVIVGDMVRFRATGLCDETGRPQAVIEQVLPRDTILTRCDSFRGATQHPIVANARQMLIVASLLQPRIKWGLVDRMLIAARSGGLAPVICLNKVDLATTDPAGREEFACACGVLEHYQSLGVLTIQTSCDLGIHLDQLKAALAGQVTVLAGHSGVGKSSLIRAIQPHLDLRIAAVSGYNDKGRHTTTSARCYRLDFGGRVIDTPGVKLFGLWGITRENLADHFPDLHRGTAPDWRKESFARIAESLP